MDDAVVNLIVLILIAVIAGIVRLVNHLREKSARREAEERRFGEEEGASREKQKDERPSGLEALLEALARAASEEAEEGRKAGPAHATPAETFEVEPHTLPEDDFAAPPAHPDESGTVEIPAEHEARVMAAAEQVRAAEAEARTAIGEAREAALAAAGPSVPAEETSPEAALAVPAAELGPERVTETPGPPGPLGGLRRGMAWALVLGRPRAFVPYGADDPAAPPGGTFD